jgi:hypothetical protein
MGNMQSEGKLWTDVGRFLGATILTLLLLTAYLYFRYAATCPTSLETISGRFNPLNVNGRAVYLTNKERLGLYVLEDLTLGSGTGFLAIALFRSKANCS